MELDSETEEGARSIDRQKTVGTLYVDFPEELESRALNLMLTSLHFALAADYPLPYNSDLSWSFLVNLIRFSYAPGWLDKVRGVVGLIKATMIGRGGTNDSG